MRLPRGARSAGLALGTAALVLLLFAGFGDNPVLRGLETASLDLRFRLRGVRPPGPEIAVVLIDDASLARLGRWPFPRTVFATALDRLDHDGAKVVAFDLLFTEPDEPISAELREAARVAAGSLPQGSDARLREALARLAGSDRDAAFAAAIATAGDVLLPVGFSAYGTAAEEPSYLARSTYQRLDSPLPPFFPLQPKSAIPPIEALARSAAGLGHTYTAFDRDGAARYDYVALPFEGDFVPSLPIRAAAQYLGVAWPQVAASLGVGIRIGKLTVPTDRAMRLLINYRGPRGTFPTYSFADLIAGRVPAAALAGRIVLVGASFTGNADGFVQPFGQSPMPGVERLANIIDTIVRRDFIGEPTPAGRIAATLAVLLAAALAGAAAEWLPTRFAALAGAAPVAGWAGAAQLAFVDNLWLPLIGPTAALATAAAATLLFRYWVVDRDGRRIRAAFRHYLPPSVISQMVASGTAPTLGGERREISVVFSDIAGSTTLAEGLDPAELTALMNVYFAGVGAAILAEDGYLCDFLGDGVLALFGAPQQQPDHADRAVAAALQIAAFGDRFSAEQQARGIAFGHTRVGVHCGNAMVGNIGTAARLKYSALGDALNTGSRLEGLNKAIGTRVCASEEIVAHCRRSHFRPIGDFVVKGRREATRVFEPLDPGRYPPEHIARYQTAYDALAARSAEAARLFAELRRDYPEDPCAGFHDARLGAGETGVQIVMTEK